MEKHTRSAYVGVLQNRRARKYSRSELFNRAIWWICIPFFSFSPRPLWAWRNFILKLCGARIGRNVRIEPDVKIFLPRNLIIGDNVGIGHGVNLYALGKIKIHTDATISQYSHLCAGSHDYTLPTMPLIKGEIEIGSSVWVAADCFVGPQVNITSGCVIGARSVVTRDLSEKGLYVGNPIMMKKVI